jgi:hypothetical protein
MLGTGTDAYFLYRLDLETPSLHLNETHYFSRSDLICDDLRVPARLSGLLTRTHSPHSVPYDESAISSNYTAATSSFSSYPLTTHIACLTHTLAARIPSSHPSIPALAEESAAAAAAAAQRAGPVEPTVSENAVGEQLVAQFWAVAAGNPAELNMGRPTHATATSNTGNVKVVRPSRPKRGVA